MDVHYAGGGAAAAAAELSFPDLVLVEHAIARQAHVEPYVPGQFSAREAPIALAALGRLGVRPDVVLCDGHGRAHPRRSGLACAIGAALDAPTIGVAKSILVGSHGPLAAERGATAPLVDAGEVIGVALRTQTGTRPVYVSVGHAIELERAVAIVLACAPRYRLPETTRVADRLCRSQPDPLTCAPK